MSKGSSGNTQTQTSKTELPGWVNSASEDNYKRAGDVADNLMGPYQGNRVAGMTPEMLEMIQKMNGNVGSTNDAFTQAGQQTNALAGYTPEQLNPQMLKNANLDPYMSPYAKNVIDPTMQIMEQSRRQALGQVGDQATQNRAFGGSRQGIAEGVTNAQSEMQKGAFVGQLQNQNFLQAQQAATGDITRDFQAQQGNVASGLQGAQFRGNMATQGADLAALGQQNWLQGLQAAMSGQNMLQGQEQKKLDAAQQLYAEQQQFPLQQLQIRQNALSQSPYGQTVTTTKPGPSEDATGKALGAGSAIIGMAGSAMAIY